MHKVVTALTVASAVAVGGLIGGVLGAPLAGASASASGAVSWVEEAISGLVDDGTITQEQADAVETALAEARPERGFGLRGVGIHALDVVAEALGMTQDELRAALAGDQTIADIAAARGVDRATVVDALVAAHRDRLDEAVAAGDLTREQADELLAGAEAPAGALVDGELPAHGGHHGHLRRGAAGPAAGDDAAPGDTDA